jgi:alpha-mannosidase
VLAAFPLAAPVDALVHGTPNHWTASQGQAVWPRPVFRATHRFVLPRAGGRTLAAIYHPEVPAWTWDDAGTLLGCVHRNVSGFPLLNDEPSSAQTVRYALRVPSGLGAPFTGQPLAESLACAQPPMAARSAVGAAVSAGWSLAEVTGGTGFILAAKRGDVAPGTLVLRLYQPTNGVETLEITLGRPAAEAIAVTALEDPIESGGPVIHLTGRRLVVTMPHALATVQVRWAE